MQQASFRIVFTLAVVLSLAAVGRAESRQALAAPTPTVTEKADQLIASQAASPVEPQSAAPTPRPSVSDQEKQLLAPDTQARPMETWFDGNIYAQGGYGAVGDKITTFDGKTGNMVGGRGAWIINHSFLLGGGGYGATGPDIEREFNGEKKRLHFGYGGLELGYVFFSERLLHLSFQTLIGAGGIGYEEEVTVGTNRDGKTRVEDQGQGDAFFVAEPMLYLETNVTQWFRICLGGGYRFVLGVDLPGVDDNTLRGASGELLFKFGHF